MSTFSTSLPSYSPAVGKGIPYTHVQATFDNTLALKQGDQAFDQLLGASIASTATGTQNNFAPGTGVNIRWAGASQITVSGLVPKANGDIRIFRNATASQAAKFTHQDAGSSAANQFTLPATGGQWIGPGGAIGFYYDGTDTKWRVLFINPGTPITRTFAAGNYAGNGSLTWTVSSGNVVTETFQQWGATVRYAMRIDTTSTGGVANTQLITTIPGGFTAATDVLTICRAVDHGVAGVGVMRALGTQILFYKDTSLTANWSAAGASDTSVDGELDIQVA